MASVFTDVKPFPAAAPNPRAVMGDNKPPLEESVVAEFLEGLLADNDVLARIKSLTDKGLTALPCNDEETAGKYADFVKMCVAAAKRVEAERETHNRPMLNAQRALKGRADSILAPLGKAEANVRAQISAFATAQRQKEEERQRLIQEEARRVAAAAEAERARLQAIADANAKAEAARLQAIEDERAAAEAREAIKVEVAAPVIEAFTPEPIAKADPAKAIAQGVLGAKVGSTTKYEFKIISVRQLPDAILNHPNVVEAMRKVIRQRVNGGERTIKGTEIWPETNTVIR